jgi:hypothetical protein
MLNNPNRDIVQKSQANAPVEPEIQQSSVSEQNINTMKRVYKPKNTMSQVELLGFISIFMLSDNVKIL